MPCLVRQFATVASVMEAFAEFPTFSCSPEEYKKIVFPVGDDFRKILRIFAYAWLDSGYMIMRQFGISQIFHVKVDTGSGSHLFGVCVA